MCQDQNRSCNCRSLRGTFLLDRAHGELQRETLSIAYETLSACRSKNKTIKTVQNEQLFHHWLFLLVNRWPLVKSLDVNLHSSQRITNDITRQLSIL